MKTNVQFMVLVWAIGVPLGLCIMFLCGFIGHRFSNHWGGEIVMFAIGAPMAILAIVAVARVSRRLLNLTSIEAQPPPARDGLTAAPEEKRWV